MAEKNPLTPEALLEEAYGAMSEGITELRRQVGLVKEKLQGGHDSSNASHLAFLLEKLATATRELRQHKKHDEEQLEDMSPEEEDECILEYIRAITAERRQKFLEELQADPGSIL